MQRKTITPSLVDNSLEKAQTGITGLDEITGGGLPRGRPTLLCGGAGCGKTLFAMEFLVHGAFDYNEPGAFLSFEETNDELIRNVRSLGFDLNSMIRRKLLALDYIYIDRHEIEETGEFDLEGLFIRLAHAIDSVGAKRVVLDTLEALFSGLPNEAILRAELRRLFRWLKKKGVTAIITAERAQGTLTRYGLEEYVADCVILLDHRVESSVSTRRLRVVKYRGSFHGTNEYPFLIGHDGVSVLPITSLGLKHPAPTQRVSTGVPQLDTMLSGKGYFRGSSVLVSGAPGTGKTSLAAAFVHAACKRGERAIYFAFEESQEQILRNMHSIGIDLAPDIRKGLLHFEAVRPTFQGLELHLVAMHNKVKKVRPRVVVIDPISNLITAGQLLDVRSTLTRLIDFLKIEQITSLFTSLTSGDLDNGSEAAVSSLMDTWLLLRNIEQAGQHNRALYILKSRGMAHSQDVRDFRLTNKGIELGIPHAEPAGLTAKFASPLGEASHMGSSSKRPNQTPNRGRRLARATNNQP